MLQECSVSEYPGFAVGLLEWCENHRCQWFGILDTGTPEFMKIDVNIPISFLLALHGHLERCSAILVYIVVALLVHSHSSSFHADSPLRSVSTAIVSTGATSGFGCVMLIVSTVVACKTRACYQFSRGCEFVRYVEMKLWQCVFAVDCCCSRLWWWLLLCTTTHILGLVWQLHCLCASECRQRTSTHHVMSNLSSTCGFRVTFHHRSSWVSVFTTNDIVCKKQRWALTFTLQTACIMCLFTASESLLPPCQLKLWTRVMLKCTLPSCDIHSLFLHVFPSLASTSLKRWIALQQSKNWTHVSSACRS